VTSPLQVVSVFLRDDWAAGIPALPTWRVKAGSRSDGTVPLYSVDAFKGLEARAVVLYLAPDVDAMQARASTYVGFSRAKAFLYVVARRQTVKKMLGGGGLRVLEQHGIGPEVARPRVPSFSRAAQEAAAEVLGIPAGRIFIEVDECEVFVSWSDVMKATDKWSAVEFAVQNVLPDKYRNHRVSVSQPGDLDVQRKVFNPTSRST
jgi:hypothetical protein